MYLKTENIELPNWKEVSDSDLFPDEQPIGYLYSFHNKLTDHEFIVVSDEMKEESVFETDSFSTKFLSSGFLWNPKTCAKMPSLVFPNGNIYTMDTYYDGKKFIKKLFRFDMSSKKILVLELSDVSVISGIYKYDQNLNFFVRKNNTVYMISISDINFNDLSIQAVLDVEKNDWPIIFKNDNGEIELRIDKTDELNSVRNFIFDNSTLNFKNKDRRQAGTLTVSLNELRILQNGTKIYVDPNNQLDTGILNPDGSKVSFKKNGDNAFLYVVDEY